jgi:hypothetical protein
VCPAARCPARSASFPVPSQRAQRVNNHRLNITDSSRQKQEADWNQVWASGGRTARAGDHVRPRRATGTAAFPGKAASGDRPYGTGRSPE